MEAIVTRRHRYKRVILHSLPDSQNYYGRAFFHLLSEKAFQLIYCVLLHRWKYMGVGIHCHSDGTVP